jgi:hypothetical protein
MIVNYTEDGWSIIMQRAHGLLAAQICGQWKKDKQPQRWVETLIATAEHDDGKDELDQPDLINKNGGPKNFKMDAFEKTDCDHLITRAQGKSLYIAILTSMHIRFLYGNETSAKRYCKALEKREKIWIAESGTNATEVSASYELLEFCDALSLLICQGLVQPENRKMEISNGPDGTVYQLGLAENGYLIVSPWPFQQDLFIVNYESRELGQLVFKSRSEFVNRLKAANVNMRIMTLSKD